MIGVLLTLIAIIAGIGTPMIAHSDDPYFDGVLIALYCLGPAVGIVALCGNGTANDAKLNAAKFRRAVVVGRQACIAFAFSCMLGGGVLTAYLPPQFQDGSGLVLVTCGVAFIGCWFLFPSVPRVFDDVMELDDR